eukprot:m.116202 g.116202  ORF g.116202 m.116202 type:complete len:2478 (-) comp9499_c0_seq1:42-7475(-)
MATRRHRQLPEVSTHTTHSGTAKATKGSPAQSAQTPHSRSSAAPAAASNNSPSALRRRLPAPGARRAERPKSMPPGTLEVQTPPTLPVPETQARPTSPGAERIYRWDDDAQLFVRLDEWHRARRKIKIKRVVPEHLYGKRDYAKPWLDNFKKAAPKTKAVEIRYDKLASFLSFLVEISKEEQSFEDGIADLKFWISEQIFQLSDRHFENTFAGVQQQMAVFKRYLAEQKPEMTKLKQELENDLFKIQMCRREHGRTPFMVDEDRGVVGLHNQNSELVAVEDERYTALRQHITHLQHLEELAKSFRSKAALRRAWLDERCKFAESAMVEDEDETALRRALRREDAMRTEVEAFQHRLDKLAVLRDQLVAASYCDAAEIRSEYETLAARWSALTATLEERHAMIERKYHFLQARQQLEQALAVCDNVHAQAASAPEAAMADSVAIEQRSAQLANLALELRAQVSTVLDEVERAENAYELENHPDYTMLGDLKDQLKLEEETALAAVSSEERRLLRAEQGLRFRADVAELRLWADEQYHFFGTCEDVVLDSAAAVRLRIQSVHKRLSEWRSLAAENERLQEAAAAQSPSSSHDDNHGFDARDVSFLCNEWPTFGSRLNDVLSVAEATQRVLAFLDDVADALEWVDSRRERADDAAAALDSGDLRALTLATETARVVISDTDEFSRTVLAAIAQQQQEISSQLQDWLQLEEAFSEAHGAHARVEAALATLQHDAKVTMKRIETEKERASLREDGDDIVQFAQQQLEFLATLQKDDSLAGIELLERSLQRLKAQSEVYATKVRLFDEAVTAILQRVSLVAEAEGGQRDGDDPEMEELYDHALALWNELTEAIDSHLDGIEDRRHRATMQRLVQEVMDMMDAVVQAPAFASEPSTAAEARAWRSWLNSTVESIRLKSEHVTTAASRVDAPTPGNSPIMQRRTSFRMSSISGLKRGSLRDMFVANRSAPAHPMDPVVAGLLDELREMVDPFLLDDMLRRMGHLADAIEYLESLSDVGVSRAALEHARKELQLAASDVEAVEFDRAADSSTSESREEKAHEPAAATATANTASSNSGRRPTASKPTLSKRSSAPAATTARRPTLSGRKPSTAKATTSNKSRSAAASGPKPPRVTPLRTLQAREHRLLQVGEELSSRRAILAEKRAEFEQRALDNPDQALWRQGLEVVDNLVAESLAACEAQHTAVLCECKARIALFRLAPTAAQLTRDLSLRTATLLGEDSSSAGASTGTAASVYDTADLDDAIARDQSLAQLARPIALLRAVDLWYSEASAIKVSPTVWAACKVLREDLDAAASKLRAVSRQYRRDAADRARLRLLLSEAAALHVRIADQRRVILDGYLRVTNDAAAGLPTNARQACERHLEYHETALALQEEFEACAAAQTIEEREKQQPRRGSSDSVLTTASLDLGSDVDTESLCGAQEHIDGTDDATEHGDKTSGPTAARALWPLFQNALELLEDEVTSLMLLDDSTCRFLQAEVGVAEASRELDDLETWLAREVHPQLAIAQELGAADKMSALQRSMRRIQALAARGSSEMNSRALRLAAQLETLANERAAAQTTTEDEARAQHLPLPEVALATTNTTPAIDEEEEDGLASNSRATKTTTNTDGKRTNLPRRSTAPAGVGRSGVSTRPQTSRTPGTARAGKSGKSASKDDAKSAAKSAAKSTNSAPRRADVARVEQLLMRSLAANADAQAKQDDLAWEVSRLALCMDVSEFSRRLDEQLRWLVRRTDHLAKVIPLKVNVVFQEERRLQRIVGELDGRDASVAEVLAAGDSRLGDISKQSAAAPNEQARTLLPDARDIQVHMAALRSCNANLDTLVGLRRERLMRAKTATTLLQSLHEAVTSVEERAGMALQHLDLDINQEESSDSLRARCKNVQLCLRKIRRWSSALATEEDDGVDELDDDAEVHSQQSSPRISKKAHALMPSRKLAFDDWSRAVEEILVDPSLRTLDQTAAAVAAATTASPLHEVIEECAAETALYASSLNPLLEQLVRVGSQCNSLLPALVHGLAFAAEAQDALTEFRAVKQTVVHAQRQLAERQGVFGADLEECEQMQLRESKFATETQAALAVSVPDAAAALAQLLADRPETLLRSFSADDTELDWSCEKFNEYIDVLWEELGDASTYLETQHPALLSAFAARAKALAVAREQHLFESRVVLVSEQLNRLRAKLQSAAANSDDALVGDMGTDVSSNAVLLRAHEAVEHELDATSAQLVQLVASIETLQPELAAKAAATVERLDNEMCECVTRSEHRGVLLALHSEYFAFEAQCLQFDAVVGNVTRSLQEMTIPRDVQSLRRAQEAHDERGTALVAHELSLLELEQKGAALEATLEAAAEELGAPAQHLAELARQQKRELRAQFEKLHAQQDALSGLLLRAKHLAGVGRALDDAEAWLSLFEGALAKISVGSESPSRAAADAAGPEAHAAERQHLQLMKTKLTDLSNSLTAREPRFEELQGIDVSQD